MHPWFRVAPMRQRLLSRRSMHESERMTGACSARKIIFLYHLQVGALAQVLRYRVRFLGIAVLVSADRLVVCLSIRNLW